MNDRFPGRTHAGEQAVQQRVGEGGPGRGSPMFGPEIATGHAEFIASRRLLVLGAAADGLVWATILAGAKGFARPVDGRTIRIAGLPADGDPLRDAFEVPRAGGMLALDPARCRRVRANGRIHRDGQGLVLRTEQVLRNCPKYIQQRELAPDAHPARSRAVAGSELTERQREWIASADTFFVASHASGHGADASHRGGRAGFVTVTGSRRLSWPDYRGNSFYMTLGNVELDPRCGLLFLDWSRGNTLHLTGESHVDWHDRAEPGAIRTIHFTIRRVVQVDNATTLRWHPSEASSFNP
ncbi:pyridoxamine 5'-phosphate oxidase family protein [Amycolatopsis sp. NBC_01480]|uniref:pyridoxamine 5'-phosphate oxidase family protein n=1 Tax=Amycolatopsis sp. NBC_01480 TaxID=2903562 RepID=UPI002E2C3D70|nr:pyridoxamine 5'-phosphate oxidase family protein [Amycolatopsis sp. NBC_01480]